MCLGHSKMTTCDARQTQMTIGGGDKFNQTERLPILYVKLLLSILGCV